MSKTFRKVSHVLFDMDGLLLDTETLYTKAFQNVLDNYGLTYEWEFKVQLMGLQTNEMAKKTVDTLNLPLSYEEFTALLREQIENLMPNCEMMPDTEMHYRNAISNIAKSFNKVYTPEIMSKITGTQQHETCRIAVEEMKLPLTIEQFKAEFIRLAYGPMYNVLLLPGAETLVKHLHKHKIPIAVATSSSKASFDVKVQKHKAFFSLFHHVVMGSSDPEVNQGKPAPDIFLVCASRFPDNPDPAQCLVFEDAPNGVTAALSAGMQVVMVPDKKMDAEKCKHATVKIDSLEDVDLSVFGLPPL